MKSIAFFNNKGGVGKTTLLCNLGAFLAKELKLKVLVIDGDPQSNATTYLLPEGALESIYLNDSSTIDSFYDSIAQGRGFSQALPEIFKSDRFSLDVLPGHPNFAAREDMLSRDWSEGLIGYARGLQTTFNFKHLLNLVSDEYDFVLIDMGPSLGAINRSILLAADYFLVPMSVDLFSMIAINNIISTLATWRGEVQGALDSYSVKARERYLVDGHPAQWNLRFLGYVMQQYRAKSVRGERKPVKSFDAIMQRFGPYLLELEEKFGFDDLESANLGQIPALASLIPLSQSAHAPVFDLGTSDGVVGAHFAAVDDAKLMYSQISKRLLQRVETAIREAV
ncbi:AAA family ATPase [Stenotrophomonas maltophilia]|uniref:ParA family protein n=1 Tax=unclassified Stenotrophomonas TaxID=196198 RepID=UPI0018D48DB3|nr:MULTISPECIES: AAA family ATPase [unclassified Stenotrophomonas]MBH1737585.1 AAA family ATPase [Stenotrophomonas maltophilia]WNB78895.1 AAA family ATPase [Stenotrophomonas sp. 9]